MNLLYSIIYTYKAYTIRYGRNKKMQTMPSRMGTSIQEGTVDLSELQISLLEPGTGEEIMPKRIQVEYYVDVNGCHICTSHKPKSNGYPQMTRNGKCCNVARHVYIECHGELPKNICVRHTCDNPMCINPNHLISGTFKQNTQDMIERNRVSRQYGETNPAHKLTETQILKIVEDLKTMKCSQIAREINIHVRTVNGIKNGEKWGWLTGIPKKRGVNNGEQ